MIAWFLRLFRRPLPVLAAHDLPEPRDAHLAEHLWDQSKDELGPASMGLTRQGRFGELPADAQSALTRVAQVARLAAGKEWPAEDAGPALEKAVQALIALYPKCHLCHTQMALWLPSGGKGSTHIYCDEHKPAGVKCISLPNAGLYRALDKALRERCPEVVPEPAAPAKTAAEPVKPSAVA